MKSGLEEDGRLRWLDGASIVAHGVRVGIRTNKPAFMDKLFDVIPGIWKPSPVPVVDRLYSLRVNTPRIRTDGRARHQLYEDLQRVANSDDLDSVLETFERQLKMYLAEMARRRVFVHAGAVGWQGRAIIIPGRSLSGKTSLVAELVRAGATYYSDEYAVLDSHGRVHPYPTPLGVRGPGAFKQKKCSVEEFGGDVGTRPLPVGLVVVSQYKAGERWRPRRLSAGHAMLELLANTIPARRRPEAVISVLQKVVSEALVLKCLRGEADDTSRLILKAETKSLLISHNQVLNSNLPWKKGEQNGEYKLQRSGASCPAR